MEKEGYFSVGGIVSAEALEVLSKMDGRMRLLKEAGFDLKQDCYLQEVGIILANPQLSLSRFAQEHCRFRDFNDCMDLNKEQPREHDAAHAIVGLVFDHYRRIGKAGSERNIDFQSNPCIEIITNDLETKMAPDGILARWRKDHPEARRLDPFHLNITATSDSAEREENYLKALGWVIGSHTGQRAANIRYAFGNTGAQQDLETLAMALGYKPECYKEADFMEVNWSITTPEGKIYACTPDGKHHLPDSNNGIENFEAVEFPDRERISYLYQEHFLPIVAYIANRHQRGGTWQQTLDSIPVAEVVNLIQHQAEHTVLRPGVGTVGASTLRL